jgi:alpha-beta hydrolase superfamily lysophospholipase
VKKQNRETYFTSKDGQKLFFQSWEPPNPEYGILVTHGQGEHSGSYGQLLQAFAQENCAIYSFDLRGHGRSEGIRGYAKNCFEYLNDFEAFLDFVLAFEKKPKKLFLFAHSMGGLVQLLCQTQDRFIKYYRPLFHAQILTSPLTEVAVAVPRWKSDAAKMMNKIFPHLTLGNEIEDSMLTRDPLILQGYKQDPLRHKKISSGVFLSFSEVFQVFEQDIHKINLPTLLLIPENDLVVSSPKSSELFVRFQSADKMKVVIPEAKHELINDLCREEVFQTMKGHIQKWIL